MHLPVIIVGAGISGLSLAQGLAKEGIPFQVYDSDASLDARSQGYRFRISDDGIDALEENLTPEHFENLLYSCGTVPTGNNFPINLDALTGGPGEMLFKPGTKVPFPVKPRRAPLAADRGLLRQALVDGIEDRVFWGRRFESYINKEETVLVQFADGSEVEGSMLVGADGTWSRVRRQQLPHHRLLDSESRPMFGKTNITKEFIEQFSETAPSGVSFIRGPDGVSCVLETMRFAADMRYKPPQDYMYWVLFLRADNELAPKNILSLSPAECTALAKKLTKNWHPSLRSLFEHANDTDTCAIHVVTSGPDSLNSLEYPRDEDRVTLIGDAAHPMSITGTLGATTGLLDGSRLIKALKKSNMNPVGMRQYEREMREYATDAITNSYIGGKATFNMKLFHELPVVE